MWLHVLSRLQSPRQHPRNGMGTLGRLRECQSLSQRVRVLETKCHQSHRASVPSGSCLENPKNEFCGTKMESFRKWFIIIHWVGDGGEHAVWVRLAQRTAHDGRAARQTGPWAGQSTEKVSRKAQQNLMQLTGTLEHVLKTLLYLDILKIVKAVCNFSQYIQMKKIQWPQRDYKEDDNVRFFQWPLFFFLTIAYPDFI